MGRVWVKNASNAEPKKSEFYPLWETVNCASEWENTIIEDGEWQGKEQEKSFRIATDTWYR